MIRKWFSGHETLTLLVLLLLISALTYLPLVGQIGYQNDDWYLMYSAGAYGPEAFVDIFSVDRPARAWVMMPAYILFGDNPLYYNLSAYVFRVISAIAFLWLLKMLWPGRNHAVFLASLLYLIYPGFLSQHNGIDYQSQMVSLAAAMLSIALSVRVVFTEQVWKKFVLLALSTLLGWVYLGLVEYSIGFELLRMASLFLLVYRNATSLKEWAWGGLKSWVPNIFTPFVFLVWRVYFFQGDRTATDVNIQFEQVRLYPIQTLYHWSVQVLQDLFDVALSAWVIPFSQLTGYIQRWSGALAFLVSGLLILAFYFWKHDEAERETEGSFTNEALILGLVVAVGGLIPIAMVNREVSFPSFSRYSLVSSAGVALFITSLIMRFNGRILQQGSVAFLVFISLLTHHANTVKAAQQTALTNDFWWQVSWRVPHLEKGTTLIGMYPNVALEEDYFIWGPANLIYYPEKQNNKNIQPGVFASILNRVTVDKVLARERQEYDNRKTITTYAHYRNILVLTQPSLNSCLHVVNGFAPEYSRGELESIRVIGSYSEIEHVLVDETPHTPSSLVFGPESDHGWCYYYQRADLARQRGEWDEVQSIGEQAFEQGLAPKDLIEWMPFLQAYAVAGDVERLAELAPVIVADPYISMQVCQILGGMTGLSDSTVGMIDSAYCQDN